MSDSQPSAFFKIINEIQNAPVKRQELIKQIEAITNRSLLTYVSSTQHPASLIDLDDSLHIESSLQGGDYSQGLDLLIHSSGGIAEAAEKIIVVCRAYSNDDFRVIVPSYAKSAATIIALGSDCIVMSDSSELGPIDPQIVINTPAGRAIRAAHSFVEERDDLLRKIHDALAANTPPHGYVEMLKKVDGPFVRECERAIKLADDIARKWLRDFMMNPRPDSEIDEAVRYFSDPNLTLSHGRFINWEQAKQKGLNICHEDKNSELWKSVWELFMRSDLWIKASPHRVKLFETARTYLNVEG
ncbi:MAG: hypothetical protein L0229_15865 [Blastocatellia bacterium]|nr:hypothetical protein [Blastocatellia bacterium]